MMSSVRAVIYTRISQDRDGDELGVTRKREDCIALAKQRGWTVVGDYVDNDVAALKGAHRPGYEAVVRAVQAGECDVVIAWDSSRLWRNRRERAEGIEFMRDARVNVALFNGLDLDLASANGRMLAGILGEFDTAESEVKAERVAAAARQRAKLGGPNGGVRAFGYARDGKLVPAEAQLIRDGYRQLLGGGTLGSITRAWNASGLTGTRGARWTPKTIRDVLLRFTNAGLSTYRGEVVGRSQRAAIVDEETYNAARALLLDPSRRTTTGHRSSYLLAGLAWCGVCGKRSIMSGGIKRPSGGRTGPDKLIYRCRPTGCVSRRQDWVDGYVVAVILDVLAGPSGRELLLDAGAPDFEALNTEALAIEQKLLDDADLYADGAITRAQLERITSRHQTRLAEIDAQRSHVSRAPILRPLVEADDPGALWERMTLDQRRAVVAVTVKVTLLPGGTGQRTFDPSKVLVERLGAAEGGP